MNKMVEPIRILEFQFFAGVLAIILFISNNCFNWNGLYKNISKCCNFYFISIWNVLKHNFCDVIYCLISFCKAVMRFSTSKRNLQAARITRTTDPKWRAAARSSRRTGVMRRRRSPSFMGSRAITSRSVCRRPIRSRRSSNPSLESSTKKKRSETTKPIQR